MFEEKSFVAVADVELELETQALESSLQPLAALPVPTNRGFELPRAIWFSMLGCYAIFFGAIAFATGGSGAARFAIIVSVIYTAIYFGVARIGARQAGAEEPSPLDRGKPLQTWTGPMDAKSVYGQVLIVPVAIALFGAAILIVTGFVG